MKLSELDHFFRAIDSRITQSKCAAAPFNRGQFESFFNDAARRQAEAKIRRTLADRCSASRFNVFEIIDPDENKLSDILANLLNPNGTHGQEALFLRFLLEQLRVPYSPRNLRTATVRRESSTHGIRRYRRRMDIFVECGIPLAIENKVDALEQVDQLKDYLEHLKGCTRGNGRHFALIYLTPDGRLPASLNSVVVEKACAARQLFCWSYQRDLRLWLETCLRGCAAPKIRHLLEDFISFIDANNHGPNETEDHEM